MFNNLDRLSCNELRNAGMCFVARLYTLSRKFTSLFNGLTVHYGVFSFGWRVYNNFKKLNLTYSLSYFFSVH